MFHFLADTSPLSIRSFLYREKKWHAGAINSRLIYRLHVQIAIRFYLAGKHIHER
jgi:hypothetical protein